MTLPVTNQATLIITINHAINQPHHKEHNIHIITRLTHIIIVQSHITIQQTHTYSSPTSIHTTLAHTTT